MFLQHILGLVARWFENRSIGQKLIKFGIQGPRNHGKEVQCDTLTSGFKVCYGRPREVDPLRQLSLADASVLSAGLDPLAHFNIKVVDPTRVVRQYASSIRCHPPAYLRMFPLKTPVSVVLLVGVDPGKTQR
jgi:hypothetical protein